MQYPVLGDGRRWDERGQRLRQGGCLCGALRYEALGEPAAVGICHCLECRKATGGVAMAYAEWPAGQVRLAGEARVVTGRSFCPACGTHVWHLNPGRVSVMLGTLDEAPCGLAPTREGWTIRREPWLAPVPGAAQFERDPG